MARRPETDQSSEVTDVTRTKVSDSGYSTACSNSQSQRSGSSKSIHSNSGSSNSSGYGCHRPPPAEEFPHPHTKSKDSFGKKKKIASTVVDQAALQTNQEQIPSKCVSEDMETTESSECQPDGELDPGGKSNRTEIVVTQAFQILSNMKDPAVEQIENLSESQNTLSKSLDNLSKTENLVRTLLNEPSCSKDEFCVVVSMVDGKVLYNTPTLSEALGFPKDMWLGRSFIDLIHQKDKVAFANHITTGIAVPSGNTTSPLQKSESKNTFFCCLRKYRGLQNAGFGVKNTETQYIPFHMSLSFKEASEDTTELYLVITAKTVKTAYKAPDDTFHTPKFSTRQLSNCIVTEIDAEAVCYLGYLPQDIIGQVVFEFYHPEDTKIIKEMYETVLDGQGVPCRSKPYRFRAQNGEWVLLETEWSSFVNPWSRKLEFIVGQHSVLKGPHNPDVFAPPHALAPIFSDEILSESKRVQDAIMFLLNESYSPNSVASKQHVSKRCKDLAVFIKTLMDEVSKPSSEKPEDTVLEEQSFSTMMSQGRDSVMLGEISPHHDGGSKSSSETPPSYSQLNYKENIARFFESKPKTTFGSDENGEAAKANSAAESEIDNSGPGSGSGSGSGSGNSSGSNQKTDSASGNGSKSKLCNGPLTRAVLSRHNEDMEKKMIQKHKELRAKDSKESRVKKIVNRPQEPNHGVKRCGSDSWEAEKILKHQHLDSKTNEQISDPMNICVAPTRDSNYQLAAGNMALWPQLSVPPSGCSIAGIIPIFYIPTEDSTGAVRPGLNPPPPNMTNQPNAAAPLYAPTIKPVPLLNAFAMFGAPPMVYPSMMVSSPAAPPLSCASECFQRPASQATTTSIKPEPGSALGSAPMSEGSKKDKSIDQEEDSPNFSPDDEKSKDLSTMTRDTGTGDESSYSSFSSLNKTDESWKYSEPEAGVSSWGTCPIPMKPPWLEDINVTPELVFRYQLGPRELGNVLEADLNALRELAQPTLVDDQLEQLYVDLERAGLSSHLDLSSGSSSGNSSGEDNQSFKKEKRRKKRNYDHGQLEMIFEENMPLPPPPICSSAS